MDLTSALREPANSYANDFLVQIFQCLIDQPSLRSSW